MYKFITVNESDNDSNNETLLNVNHIVSVYTTEDCTVIRMTDADYFVKESFSKIKEKLCSN